MPFIMLEIASLHLTYKFPDASEAVLQLTHLTGSPVSAAGRTKGRKALHFFSVTLHPRDGKLRVSKLRPAKLSMERLVFSGTEPPGYQGLHSSVIEGWVLWSLWGCFFPLAPTHLLLSGFFVSFYVM